MVRSQNLKKRGRGTEAQREEDRSPSPGVSASLCLTEQRAEASIPAHSRTALRVVNALSIAELRQVSLEDRRRLQARLSAGHISRAVRRAVNKLAAASLVEAVYRKGVVIKGPPEFIDLARAHLDLVSRTPTGRKLLLSLSRSGRTVTIAPSNCLSEAAPSDYRGAFARGKVLAWTSRSGRRQSIKGDGTGSDTIISYNPHLTRIGPRDWQSQPPALWLAHELIHADDAAYGRMDPEEVDGLRNYERQAIGLPPYADKRFTENRLRAEWEEPQPPRPRY